MRAKTGRACDAATSMGAKKTEGPARDRSPNMTGAAHRSSWPTFGT
jgi:hypothetical protein